MNRYVYVAVLNLALMAPATIRAQESLPPPHFVFRVPLDVSGLAVSQPAIAVVCRVFTEPPAGSFSGQANIDIDLQTGRPVVDVAEVPVRLPVQINPYDVRSYECSLETHAARVGDFSGRSIAVNQAENGIDQSKPMVMQVRGDIPR